MTAFVTAGATVIEVNLPPEFNNYFDRVDVLSAAGMATNHGADYDRHSERMSPKLRQLIERGRTISAIAYPEARHAAVHYNIAKIENFVKL